MEYVLITFLILLFFNEETFSFYMKSSFCLDRNEAYPRNKEKK